MRFAAILCSLPEINRSSSKITEPSKLTRRQRYGGFKYEYCGRN